MNVAKLALAVSLPTVLAACAFPFPHFPKESPLVEGVLSDGGKPIVGRDMFLVSGDESAACIGKTTKISTQIDGGFSF